MDWLVIQSSPMDMFVADLNISSENNVFPQIRN